MTSYFHANQTRNHLAQALSSIHYSLNNLLYTFEISFGFRTWKSMHFHSTLILNFSNHLCVLKDLSKSVKKIGRMSNREK